MGNRLTNASDTERLSEALGRKVDSVLRETHTTAELWHTVQRLGPTAPGEAVLTGMLRTALRVELARREEQDIAKIYSLVKEALVTGDLRPFWEAREAYSAASPDATGRLFPHEPDGDDAGLPRNPEVPNEAYELARRLVREQIDAIEETTPTGSTIEAFAVLEDAIDREEPERREPLRYALEVERRRQARTTRNLVRTRLALSLMPGRSYEHFLANRIAYADLSVEDRVNLFATT